MYCRKRAPDYYCSAFPVLVRAQDTLSDQKMPHKSVAHDVALRAPENERIARLHGLRKKNNAYEGTPPGAS
jgi:hypothetical protein